MKGIEVKKYLLAFLLCAGATSSSAEGFDLKGLALGQTERAVKALYPDAKCEGPGATMARAFKVTQTRICNLGYITLAGRVVDSATITLVKDSVQYMEFFLSNQGMAPFRHDLAEKFGKPIDANSNLYGAVWVIGETRMKLESSGTSLRLVVRSQASYEEALRQPKPPQKLDL